MTDFGATECVPRMCAACALGMHRMQTQRCGFTQRARSFGGLCNLRSGKACSGGWQMLRSRGSLIKVNNQASSYVRRAASYSCQQGVQ